MKKCQPKVLTPYVDDELAADARHQVEEHLQSCASCGALLDEVMSARERVHNMGRSIIPNTVLMPALEAFRERAGIGRARLLELADIPVPVPMEEAHLDDTPIVAPATPVEECYVEMLASPNPDPPNVEAPAAVDAAPGPAAFVAEEVTGPAFPPLPPDPYAGGYADAYEAAVEAPFEEPAPVMEEAPFAEEAPPLGEERPVLPAIPFDAPWSITYEEPEAPADLSSEPFAAETPAAEEEVVDLAAAQAETEAAAAALEARPEAPAPYSPPPWLEAEAADAEDMEARGRLLIEEDLAQENTDQEPGLEPVPEPVSHAPLAAPEAEPHADAPQDAPAGPTVADDVTTVLAPGFTGPYAPSGVGVEEAVARMRQELDPPNEMEPLRAALAAAVALPPRDDAASEYREALRARSERERPAGLAGLDTQARIGLGIAAAILLLVVGVFVVPRLLAKPAAPVALTGTQPLPHASAAASVPPSPATSASAAPAQPTSVIPALTDVATGGGGGTGFQVARIRTGNPASGVYRVVLDLSGGGSALPDVRLGRGPDGSLYLESAGMSADPAVLAAFPGAGPVTAITAVGGSEANLRFATTGQPGFSMYYLTGPNRLVIDLK